HVDRIYPIVADQRVSHRDDLAFVRGIGQDLPIPGHRGVKAHLAAGRNPSAKPATVEKSSVFQRENGLHFCSFFSSATNSLPVWPSYPELFFISLPSLFNTMTVGKPSTPYF